MGNKNVEVSGVDVRTIVEKVVVFGEGTVFEKLFIARRYNGGLAVHDYGIIRLRFAEKGALVVAAFRNFIL